MNSMENFVTGGEEYYIVYRHGTFCVLSNDIVLFIGTCKKCHEYMRAVIENNVDYDWNFQR